MNTRLMKIVAVAAIAVLLVAGASALVYSLTKDDGFDDGKGTTITIDVISGNHTGTKHVTLVADRDVFGGADAGHFVFYVTDLDGYVSGGAFNADKFYVNLTVDGTEDPVTGELIPKDAKRFTGNDLVNFEVTNPKRVAFDIRDGASYAHYAFRCEIGDRTVAESVIDAPGSVFLRPAPTFVYEGEIIDRQKNPEFVLRISGATFSENISADDLRLMQGFDGLKVKDLSISSDRCMLTIVTEGLLLKTTASFGSIEFAENATSYGEKTVATCGIADNYVVLGNPFEKNGKVCFDTFYSDNFANAVSVTIGGTEFKFENRSRDAENGCNRAIAVANGIDDIDEFMDGIYGAEVTVSNKVVTYVYPMGAYVTPTVENAVTDGNNVKLTVRMHPEFGKFNDGADKSNFSVGDLAEITDVARDGADMVLDIAYPDTGCVFDTVTVKDCMTSAWGTPAETSYAVVSYAPEKTHVPSALGGKSSGEIVSGLYKTESFGELFDKSSGTDLILSVLDVSGMFVVPNVSMLTINGTQMTCEEVRTAVALQTSKYNAATSPVISAKGVSTMRYAVDYMDYVNAANRFAGSVADFGSSVKAQFYDFISGVSSMYLYVTQDGRLTIMHGDYTNKQTEGTSVFDGKEIDFSKTIRIRNMGDVFTVSSTFGKFIDGRSDDERTTPYNVIKELSAYFELNGIQLEGYTQDELAEAAYKTMLCKFAEIEANSDAGRRVIECYMDLAEAATPSDPVTGEPISEIHSPIQSFINAVGMKCNFYSEAKQTLTDMNEAFALNMYISSMIAATVDGLSSEEPAGIGGIYEKAISYIRDNSGRVDVSDKDYCYVTKTFVTGVAVDVEAKGEFHSKDNWVSDQVVPVTGLGIEVSGRPANYLNSQQIEEMLKRYCDAGMDPAEFKLYLESILHANLKNDLATSMSAPFLYSKNDGVVLTSWNKDILSGQSSEVNRVLKKNTLTAMAKSITNSPNYECTFDRDMYGNFAMRGEIFDLTTNSLKNAGGNGFAFAIGFVASHHASWSYDEAQIYTPGGSLNEWTLTESDDGRNLFFDYRVSYSMIALS